MAVVTEKELLAPTRKKVQEILSASSLPGRLPWGVGVTITEDVVSDNDNPCRSFHSPYTSFEVGGNNWVYLNVRAQVDSEGFQVYWKIQVDTETGQVIATARPLVIPFKHSIARCVGEVDEAAMGCVSRVIGQIEPLVQLFGPEIDEMFSWVEFDKRWGERTLITQTLNILRVRFRHRRDDIDDKVDAAGS